MVPKRNLRNLNPLAPTLLEIHDIFYSKNIIMNVIIYILIHYSNIIFATPETRPSEFEIFGDYVLHPPDIKAKFDERIATLVLNTSLSKASDR